MGGPSVSFATVLANVQEVTINMDVSTSGSGNLESRIDNVALTDDCPPVMSDFADCTLQGWTKVEPFCGDLLSSAAGNPGCCLEVTDTAGGCGGLLIQAPASFTGDLSLRFCGIEWDEFVPDAGALTTSRTIVYLQGASGTRFLQAERYDHRVSRSAVS